MKKVMIALIVFVMFFTIKVYAADVKITDIKCDNLYDSILKEDVNVEVNALNLTIGDTYFAKEGDYLRCTLEITNSSDEPVEVSSQAVRELSNDNVSYSLTSTGDNIIEAGKSKTFTFLAEYKKVLDRDGEFDNVIEIKIANDTIIVPDTLVKSLVVILITLTSVVSVVLLIKTRNKAYLALFVGTVFLIMPTAKALVNATLTVNSKIIVEVSERNKVIYEHEILLTDEEAEEKLRNHNYLSIEKTNYGSETDPVYISLTIGGKEYFIFDVRELDKNYLPGEEVDAKEIIIPYSDGSNCTVNSETNIATCESLQYFSLYGWTYDDGPSTDLNIANSTMEVPAKFTMPDHDITLKQNFNYIVPAELTVTYEYATYLTEEEAEEYEYKVKGNQGKYVYDGKDYYRYIITIIDKGYKAGERVDVRNIDIVNITDCAYDDTNDVNNCTELGHSKILYHDSTHIREMNFGGSGEIIDGGCASNAETDETICADYIRFTTPMSFTMPRENVLINTGDK